MAKDDMKLTLLLADIDEVITNHHATTADVLAAGEQLIYTAYGQICNDCPTADLVTLADSIADTLRRRLMGRILATPAQIGKA